MTGGHFYKYFAIALGVSMRATAAMAQAVEPSAEIPTDNSHTPVTAPQSDSLIPTDQQLEASGARIGNIEIKVVDVFDPENPKESGAIYRAANYLHINTREQTVRPQLLFKPGEVYSQRLLEETARNLRARQYLEDASVTPVHYDPTTNTVDILVRVHDVWTLNPGVSYGRSGGQNNSGAQISESNLLGWGKSVSVDRSQDVDRNSWKFAYGDNNLLSSRWELQAGYSNASDGGSRTLTIDRPFYSLDTHWSATFDATHLERIDHIYQRGDIADQYVTQQSTAGVQGGWSNGLQSRDGGVPWIQRWSFGYRTDELRYSPDLSSGTTTLPTPILLHYPFLGVSWFQDEYEVVRNRDLIARTEDLYIGRALSLRIGYAARSMGSDRNATVIDFSFQDAYRLSERQWLFASFAIDGRRQNNQWQGTVISSGLRYDIRETAKSMLVLSLKHANSEHPDASQQLFLGSDEGMRGYPLRYRAGTQRTVLIVEQRVYTDKQILRLLSVGGAGFIDVGHIGGTSDVLPGESHVLTDVGFGLRLGNIRSSRGDMFHLDLAYPLNAEGKDRKLQFSVITQHTF